LKKTFLILVAFSILLGFSPKAEATNLFKDVNLYEEEITYLTGLSIIKGYDGNLFKPKDSIKRIQAIQMILREKGVTNFSNVPNPGFTDINPGDYGYKEVAKAVQLGIIGGKTASDGSKYFDTFGTLTRAQMAKILVNAYNLTGTYPKSFTDVPTGSYGHWAKDFISSLAANHITTGYDDGSFKPEDKLTREHFAVFMARQLNDKFKPNSRYNPAKQDDLLIVDVDDWVYGHRKYQISLVDKVMDGEQAWSLISEANIFNDPAPAGKKYVLAKFYFKLLEADQEPFEVYSVGFEAVSKNGVVYEPAFVVEPEPALWTDIYIGGVYKGWAAFLVDEKDEPLIVWNREFDDEVWFSLE
jgi:hypothetical protein